MMKQSISKVTSACFYHITSVEAGPEVTANLVFVASRLGYFNSLLAGFLSLRSPIATGPERSGQANHGSPISGSCDAISTTTLLAAFQISYTVIYKLCILLHQVHTGCSPAYLTNLVTACAVLTTSSLCLQQTL